MHQEEGPPPLIPETMSEEKGDQILRRPYQNPLPEAKEGPNSKLRPAKRTKQRPPEKAIQCYRRMKRRNWLLNSEKGDPPRQCRCPSPPQLAAMASPKAHLMRKLPMPLQAMEAPSRPPDCCRRKEAMEVQKRRQIRKPRMVQ